MTFDTLTWISLMIFFGALIGFVYGCLMRSCIDSYEENSHAPETTRRENP